MPTVAQPDTIEPEAIRRSWSTSDRLLLAAVIAAGTVLRLFIAQWGRYFEDSQVLAFRSERLAELPPTQLYQTNQGVIGHLPGDLWFVWFIANVFRSIWPDGSFYGDTFHYLTKLVPINAEAGAAFALALIAGHLAGPRAGLIAAALYAFNPGPITVAAIWGQWDSISTCAALFALWFFLRRRFEISAAVLTYAVLVKPQFAIFGLLFAIVYLRNEVLPVTERSRWIAVARAGASVLAGWVTAQIVLLPFNVSIWPLRAQFDLADRLRYAFSVHDETTLNAFNLWATPLAGNAVEDNSLSLLGLDARAWGQLFLGAAILTILALWWHRGSQRAMIWAAFAVTFSAFLLPTRIHERYLLPSVALALLFAAVQPRLLWFAGAVSASYAANVIAVYVLAHDQQGAPFFSRHDPWMTLAAFFNLALLAWTFWAGPGALEDGRASWAGSRLGWMRFRPARNPLRRVS